MTTYQGPCKENSSTLLIFSTLYFLTRPLTYHISLSEHNINNLGAGLFSRTNERWFCKFSQIFKFLFVKTGLKTKASPFLKDWMQNKQNLDNVGVLSTLYFPNKSWKNFRLSHVYTTCLGEGLTNLYGNRKGLEQSKRVSAIHTKEL